MKSLRQASRSAKTKNNATKKRSVSARTKKPNVSKTHKPQTPHVHRWMNVLELAELHPGAGDILAAYGLHCIGCAYSEVETLEEGALAHGLSDDDISNILIDLEDLLRNGVHKPQTITITESAGRALMTIALEQKKEGYFLRVTTDDTGGFCMEFVETKEEDDMTFGHPNIAKLSVIASKETLDRIGGSTIDHREGRFKLDLAEKKMCACDEKGCACEKM